MGMEALSNSSNDNSSNNSSNNSPMGHSSFSTVDINISNHDDNKSSDSIGDDDNFQTQIQQDIIQQNILYVSKHCHQNNEIDGSDSSEIDVNVEPIRSDRNETDKTDNSHHEGAKSDPDIVLSLGKQFKHKTHESRSSKTHNIYLKKRRKKNKHKSSNS